MTVSLKEPARLLLAACLFCCTLPARAVDARFDLVGPRVDVRVTRGADTLPIAAVPNLQAGDKLWIHPDLPPTQSVHYLLICAFLRGTTNPPPDDWFIRVATWDKKVREEGVFVTVPADAEQAVLFMAPETGGDFSTLKSAVKGRPGIFVRASQDLAEAGFEQARIEKYLASIRQVPPTDSADLQKHSDLLARTLALKPNDACFKQPVDTQFTCLTQTGTQTLLDDGHGQSLVTALSTGQNSDFINAASYTKVAGAGDYSAYVGAIIDLVRIMGSIHTAQYQYIPAIAFPQGESLNLRLNTPPSFHNPKSVLVIGLPAVQKAIPPPLRSADANYVACMLRPSVVLPIEGAPLVFSTGFAHDLILHLNTPTGAPAEPDIHLAPDAYQGGLVLQKEPPQHVPLHDEPKLLAPADQKAFVHPEMSARSNAQSNAQTNAQPQSADLKPATATGAKPMPVLLTGTISGRWGFDPFTGPEVQLQQLPGTGWHIIPPSASATPELIAGHSAQLVIAATGTACVHTISAQPDEASSPLPVAFKREASSSGPADLSLTLPLEHAVKPGDLHLAIQQYGQPEPDQLAARTFSEPAHIAAIEVHAGDRTLKLTGSGLEEVKAVRLGDLVFTPATPSDTSTPPSANTLFVALPANAPAPPTQVHQHLSAIISLQDGRTISQAVQVDPPRPVLTLLRKASDTPVGNAIALSNPDDIPLSQRLTFTLKSADAFPRSGQIEVATVDGTLRSVLTLAPSGGLVLQDPHTLVATLDPLRSFGPSAFGSLRLRAVYPEAAPRIHNEHTPPQQISVDSSGKETVTTASYPEPEPSTSDWLPLGTLVRLPALGQLECPADTAQPCTLTGENLFLIQALALDQQFTTPTAVPDGFTGTALQIPHVAGSLLYLKLRDDPAAVDLATPATAPVSGTAVATGPSGRKSTRHP